jgi:hypothetical protein
VRSASDCYKAKSTQSAACIAETVGDPDHLVRSKRGNFAGAYPPVYYATMSVFASTNIAVSVLIMRLVNVLLFVAFATVLYLLLPRSLKRTLVWMWAITVVPLGTFLISSNNPSAWAVLSGGSVWIALLGYFRTHGRRKVLLAAVAGLAVLVGAGARADSAVYAGIAIVLVGVLTFEPTRRYTLSAIAPVAFLAVAFALYRLAGQSSVAESGLTGSHTVSGGGGSGGGGGGSVIANNLLEIPSLWAGNLGTWSLGWLDTPMPAIVWFAALLIFGAMVFRGLAWITPRKVSALGVAALALVAIPSWVLYQGDALVGQEVQPRYVQPLLIMFAGMALLEWGRRGRLVTPFQSVMAAAALMVANSVALLTNLRRYVSGLDSGSLGLDHGTWWWQTPVSPLVVWFIGSAAFGCAVVIALLHVSRTDLWRRRDTTASNWATVPIKQ